MKRIDFLNNFLIVVFVFALSATLLYYTQFSITRLVGFDGYYHIKLASMMLERGFSNNFPWMQHSVLNSNFIDMHFVYHLILIPFTFGNLMLGAKLSAVFLGSALFTFFYVFLKKHNIKYSLVWLILFFSVSYSFLFRLSLVRPAVISIIILIALIHFVIKENKLAVFGLSFLYVWTYTAFLLAPFISVIYSIILYLKNKKLNYILPISTIFGVLAGLIINPYFPENIKVYYIQIVSRGIDSINIYNQEWAPLAITSFIKANGFLIPVLALALVIFFWFKKYSTKSFFLLVLTVVFFASAISSNRFIEYFVPIAVIFSALNINELIKKTEINFSSMKHIAIIIIVALFILLAFYVNVGEVKSRIQKYDKLNNFEGCANWLNRNSEQGSAVYISQYAEFPALFFYSENDIYTTGLDLYFLYNYNKTLYKSYISNELKANALYESVAYEFNSSYAFVNKNRYYNAYLNAILADNRFELKYQDNNCAIFSLNH